MKPLPPALSAACCRALISGSSGRGNGIRSMITSWQVSPGTSRPCHRLSVPNRQVCGSLDELLGQLGQLGVALRQRGEVRQPLADRLRGGLGGPPAGEQPEGAAVGGVDEPDDLVELRLARGRRARAAAGAGRGRGCPAGRSRTASPTSMPRQGSASWPRLRPRGAGLQEPLGGLEPDAAGDGGEVAAEHQRGAGEHHGLVGEQLVAHLAPHLQRRDAQPRRDPVAVALGEPQHVGRRGRRPSARRTTKTSCTEPLAWVRPASASPSPSLGYAERQARAASRTSTSASARCSRHPLEAAGLAVARSRRAAPRRRRRGRRPGRPRRGAGSGGRPARRRRRPARRWRPG